MKLRMISIFQIEVLEENLNGGIIDYDKLKVDFEGCLDRSEH